MRNEKERQPAQDGAADAVGEVPPERPAGGEAARQMPWRAPVVSRRALRLSGFPEVLDEEIEELDRTEALLARRFPGATRSPR